MGQYSATCYDKTTGNFFTKYFDEYSQLKSFVIRCGYGRKLQVVGFITYDQWQFDEINYFSSRKRKKVC